MTRILILSNALTAAMAALCWLCSHSLGLLLLWTLVLVPIYLVAMAWWVLCCERFEEQSVPSAQRHTYQFIGANDKSRANQPPRKP